MPEVILILVIALIVFGPRKLPELGKSLGQAMAQFRRASDEFKRTWEQEVEMERYRTPAETTDTASAAHAADAPASAEPHALPAGGEPVAAATPTAAPAAEPAKKHWI
jgi:TatA/E family protein of Tat protein translocase